MLEDSFRKGLFKNTKLTRKKWNDYWKEMNDFRGGYATHRELNYSKPVPQFKTAESVAYFYDKWIRKLIEPDIFDEQSLKESVALMKKEIRPLAMHYLSETKLTKPDTE